MSHVTMTCKACKSEFRISAALYQSSIKNGYPRKFCSKGCFLTGYKRKSAKEIIKKHTDLIKKLSAEVLKKRPVTTMAQMSPEKQAELRRLYEIPKRFEVKSENQTVRI